MPNRPSAIVNAVMNETRVRRFIDPRAYAASATQTGDWLAGRGTPAFADESARVVALAPLGHGRVTALMSDEFLILLSGKLAIESTVGTTIIEANRSAVLPAGLTFNWRAAGSTVAIIVSCPAAEGIAGDVVSVSLEWSNPPSSDLLVGPTPSCRSHSDYRSASGEFTCGTWDSTPYHRRAITYRHIELMHLLEGSVTFEDALGSVTFRKGDIFLAARGAECAWISKVPVKKVYAIHRPA